LRTWRVLGSIRRNRRKHWLYHYRGRPRRPRTAV